MVAVPATKMAEGVQADKVMYYYKLISVEPVANKCHILGFEGATSGTNTKTVQTTQGKGQALKQNGSSNQQRVVNVILTKDDGAVTDVARDLYYAWDNNLQVGIWRVDWNTLRKVDGKLVVNAEFSVCIISTLPETEPVGGTVSQNVTFEVQGRARRYDDEGNPFTMTEEDFDEGMFNAIMKFYNFTHPVEVGTDGNGGITNNAKDDSHAGDPSGTKPLGESKDNAASNV
ncbi:hypothetical protein [Limosilactobacillus reuteri]|uniref:Phage tail protein n=1 Tax=Limosilactobacillus reuteri subsp. rodentium (strain DSM 17509 / CIP 109821 / 100-23) TaxID=349123 RepID=B3XM69_LIMR1|nr:hypothetical protein [Limosilactobacillus reuteri]EDX42473.1 hypothetical protein Lreu23DRAFT_3989 [Limosilactobacillus reuteri subsp. rodentium]MCC4476497.1 hypothetical protein [Limosilactobacillus reuteri]